MTRTFFGIRSAEIFTIALLVLASVVAILSTGARAAALCFPVTTSRGVLTTAMVDQTSGTIDATGCDIGDYIQTSTTVSGLTVHDANQYGIFVDSQLAAISVSISGATVYNIGAHTGTSFTPNGVQTGIDIIFDSGASGPTASGSIDSSTIYAYQKGGIVINHNSIVSTTNNVVTGLGPVNYIAQNG